MYSVFVLVVSFYFLKVNMMEIFQENVVLILILLETDNTNGKILEISIEVYIEKNKEMNKVIILNLHTVDLGVFN